MTELSNDTFASIISVATALLVVILLLLGVIPKRVVDVAKKLARSLAGKQPLLMVLIPAISFMINAAIADKNGIPRARVQDEHSYLLAADTFTHGRLTNPTPAFWEHFETVHELVRPTYMSKYPPGQGLALALGQVSTGLPIVGIWLVAAAGCAAIYWMLLGFTPPVWALLGGVIALLHPQLIQWSQNYWGGSLAVLGGAMVLGSWIRLKAKACVFESVVLAIGLCILANSRPYEGLILSIPLMMTLFWKRKFPETISIAIPALVIILPVSAAMGYYNFRITGHALRMPFQEYARQYDVYPKIWFFPKQPQPAYRNDFMRDIHTGFEQGDYYKLRTLSGFFRVCVQRFWTLIAMNARQWVLLIPLIAALTTFRDKTLRWIWLTAIIFLIGLYSENFFLVHYAAPLTGLMMLLIVIGWQRIGWILSVATMMGFIVGALTRDFAALDYQSDRAEQTSLIAQAQSLQTGRHLIFVKYAPDHLIQDEWVYNAADLADSPIIWARYMGPRSDFPVTQHYAGRDLWILTVGGYTLDLNVYDLVKPSASAAKD